MQKGISQIRRMLNLIWSDSCLDLFCSSPPRQSISSSKGPLGPLARHGGPRDSEEGRGERGRGRGGVRLITSLQANLYFELIFALPTWREGKKGEIQLRRRDWERQNLES